MDKIAQKILDYKQVYEHAGVEPPPYRITCKEHKELIDCLNKFFLKTSFDGKNFRSEIVKQQGIVNHYDGIELEVVMVVDPYF